MSAIKFGKPSGPFIRHKTAFFEDNDRLLEEATRINRLYVSQPPRARCKNCDKKLDSMVFAKQGVGYTLCDACGHLNGMFEDSAVFCRQLYADNGGKEYAKSYSSADRTAFRERVTDIYVPKIKFLVETLASQGEDPVALNYADIGSGSGYLLEAYRQAGAKNLIGLEPSEVQADLANRMIGTDLVETIAIDTLAAKIVDLECDVVSLIGVLEHLQNPREILAAIKDNCCVRYLFLSLPLFSASVFLEMAFPKVMHRQLTGGHTHLYTDQSIDHFCGEFGFERIAEWWFGTDIVDLHRNILVTLGGNDDTAAMADAWGDLFSPLIDDLQMVFDRRKLSSHVHLVLRSGG